MSLNLFSKIIVASAGAALAGIGTAAAEGHVAPWWVIILIGVIAAAAGVITQSPVDHEAIAERKANAAPPAVVFLLAIGLASLSACAHATNVATACAGTITANLRNNVASALDREDYVSALEVAGTAVLPCVLVAAVKEVRDASAAASGTRAGEPKMAMRLDLVVRVRRADNWLAAHPDAGGSPPPK